MLVEHGRASVSVRFEDRDGNHGQTRLWFPFALPDTSIATYMDLFIARVGALSDAAIRSWQVVRTFEDDAPSSAGASSDLIRRLVLYYRNGEDHDRIWVPSARLDLMEPEGLYAGLRLDALRPEVAAILLSMQDVVAFIVTPEADTFPTTFVVGGVAL